MTWIEANQHDLVRALDRIKRLLSTPGDGTAFAEAPPPMGDEAHANDLALVTLVRRFGLSAFERDVLVMCAGMELDAGFAPLVAARRDAPGRGPSFGLALAMLPDPHWSALAPDGPLRAWRLVELFGPGVADATLRIDERVLHFLAGVQQLDERLHGMVDPQAPVMAGGSAVESLAERVAAHLRGEGIARIVQITGGGGEGRLRVASSACARLGAGVLRVRGGDLPSVPLERASIARLLAREAILGHAVPVLDMSTEVDASRIAGFVESLAVPAIVCVAEPVPLPASVGLVVAVPVSTAEERLAAWANALGEYAGRLNGDLGRICAQFDLNDREIRAVGAQCRAGVDGSTPDETAARLWDACREAARPRMDGLAQPIAAIAGWEDLVLPEPQHRLLHEIAAQVRQRHRVYEEWGFARKSARGLGISALFSGASGTGKTMAAEVLARELRLDLYRIDLASVVSKYVGETEKNLKRVFDAAEVGGAILLFDEADALFGKRSEVKDSHDRYANIEVSYLLQRMEAYRGLAILTSNLKNALDSAFMRRIRFIVHFPFPDTAHRAAIWRKTIPSAAPTEALDWDRLAQLKLSGGHIRNTALAAMFLAADQGEPVGMAHLAAAARAEYAKLERSLSDAEARGWA